MPRYLESSFLPNEHNLKGREVLKASWRNRQGRPYSLVWTGEDRSPLMSSVYRKFRLLFATDSARVRVARLRRPFSRYSG
jgi:hypothetical protein